MNLFQFLAIYRIDTNSGGRILQDFEEINFFKSHELK